MFDHIDFEWWWPLDTLVLGACRLEGLAPLQHAAPGLRSLQIGGTDGLTGETLREWSTWKVFEHVENLDVSGPTDIRYAEVDSLPEPFRSAVLKTLD